MKKDQQQPESIREPDSPKKQLIKGDELIVESDVGPEVPEFRPEQSKSIAEAVSRITIDKSDKNKSQSWLIARRKVELFKPVPWFLWRLALSVFSKPVGSAEINEGMILGLRRLLFAAASDPILGSGAKVNSVKKAMEILSADVIAAISIIHSICRRLKSCRHENIWRPMLDEALVQAQIGFEMGKVGSKIGRGRGMLAGFVSPIGLAVLVACGDNKQAEETVQRMSAGEANASIGQAVYGCEPMQVSSMLLAATGCGADAANGMAASEHKSAEFLPRDGLRALWASAVQVVSGLRAGKARQLESGLYDELGIEDNEREELQKKAIKIARAGHSWQWVD